MPKRTYALCDSGLAIQHPDQQQLARIGRLWETLFSVTVSTPRATCPTASFQFEPCREDVLPLDPRAQSISNAGGLQVWKTPTGFRLATVSSVFDLDLRRGSARGVLDETFWRLTQDVQRRTLLPAYVVLAHGAGRYALHANGVVQGTPGWLIIGPSGCGKTTLGLTLVREGWSHLSDDLVLLRQKASGVAALAVTRGFSCTPHTAASVSQLRGPVEGTSEKSLLHAEEIAEGRQATDCYPSRLLFPTIADRESSRVIAMSSTEALTGLIQNSAGIMVQRKQAAGQPEVLRQLKVLRELVRQTSCYRFLAGADVLNAPHRVARLLSEIPEG